MQKKRNIIYAAIAVVCIIALIAILRSFNADHTGKYHSRSYQDIINSGIIHATTEYNSIGFHVENDTIAGFHYELIQEFAKSKGLKVQITPSMSLQEQIEGLNTGKYDIIASSMLITTEQKDSVLLFTQPILHNRQILVQRKPSGDTDSTYIKDLLELGKKTVYIPQGSPAYYRIQNLATEIADTIYIKEIPKYSTEQLMSLVAHSDIDYAICEESIAKGIISQYPQLDIDTAISFNQFYGWGVNKESAELRDSINLWLEKYMQTKDFSRLTNRYFK